jgi:uridine kinase
VALASAAPPTLGQGRLVCIDGPAGSGKTTLAATLGGLVVHMDDLYPGWDGLPLVDAQLGTLLGPLAEGRPGSYRRYDWLRGEFAETVVLEPVPLLVLEGVGSGARAYAEHCTLLVWVEAPHDLRMARGVARDGEAFAAQWEQWARDEALVFERERTRERADVVLDGTRPYSEQ